MTYTNEQIEAMAWRIAEALRSNGWHLGGDYEEEFFPDIRAALKLALKEIQK